MRSVISSEDEAPAFPCRIGARCGDRHAHPNELLDASNANFRASKFLREPFVQRSRTCYSGTDSHRNAANRSVAGVGLAQSKNYRQHRLRPDRNVVIRLHDLRFSMLPSMGPILWRTVILSFLRFGVSASLRVFMQGGDFRQQQGRVVSLRGIALTDQKSGRIVPSYG